MLKVYFNTVIQYVKIACSLAMKYGLLNSLQLVYRFIQTRIQFSFKMSRLRFLPPNYYLFMTKRCNLTCDFCHYYGELDKPTNQESDQEFTLGDLKRFESEKILFAPAKVCLYGGEPMLNEDFFDCVKYLNDRGYISSTITNGTYLKKYLDQLISEPLHQMTISYYNGIAERFQDEIRSISKKTLVNISYIIASDDYRELERVIEFSIDSGVHFLTVENLVEKQSCSRKSIVSDQHYECFKKDMLAKFSSKIIFRWSEVQAKEPKLNNEKIHCSEPWDMMLLDKKGRTLPCCQYPLSDFSGACNDANEVFNTTELVEMREKMGQGEVPKKCEGCHYLYAKDPLYNFK